MIFRYHFCYSSDMNEKFFKSLDQLVINNGFSVDRPKGTAHPRYPDYIYELNYGYINSTKSTDNAEIDAWIGTDGSMVTGIIVTFDRVKSDSEMKLCIGCTVEEKATALKSNNRGDMNAILINR